MIGSNPIPRPIPWAAMPVRVRVSSALQFFYLFLDIFVRVRIFIYKLYFMGTKKKQRLLSEILTDGVYHNATKLKMRLFNEGVKEYKCEKCGISEWNGEHITLEIHHINGNHKDNRLENLQILCPNCHSQTINFNGKSKNLNCEDAIEKLKEREEIRQQEIEERKKYWSGERKKTKPVKTKICLQCGKSFIGRGEKYCSRECASKASVKTNVTIEQIYEAAKEVKSLIQLGKKFNMTDNGIRKILNRYGILNEVKEILKHK
ncbi:MAG: HNH endonuclease [Clostridia bacterium]|nr:HNH endonuclease [Clostridia bacterium]